MRLPQKGINQRDVGTFLTGWCSVYQQRGSYSTSPHKALLLSCILFLPVNVMILSTHAHNHLKYEHISQILWSDLVPHKKRSTLQQSGSQFSGLKGQDPSALAGSILTSLSGKNYSQLFPTSKNENRPKCPFRNQELGFRSTGHLQQRWLVTGAPGENPHTPSTFMHSYLISTHLFLGTYIEYLASLDILHGLSAHVRWYCWCCWTFFCSVIHGANITSCFHLCSLSGETHWHRRMLGRRHQEMQANTHTVGAGRRVRRLNNLPLNPTHGHTGHLSPPFHHGRMDGQLPEPGGEE